MIFGILIHLRPLLYLYESRVIQFVSIAIQLTDF